VCTWQRHVSCPASVCRRRLGRSSPVSLWLCSLRGSPGALDSDVHWPAQLCWVRFQDLKPTTNRITRTVALFIQVPLRQLKKVKTHLIVCSSTRHRQCWLQLWVSCTIVRRCCDCTANSASTKNVQTRLDSTRHFWLVALLSESSYSSSWGVGQLTCNGLSLSTIKAIKGTIHFGCSGRGSFWTQVLCCDC